MTCSRPQSCQNVVALSDEPHHHLVIDNESVRAYAVEIGPYQRTLCHVHSVDYLTYVAGNAEIRSTPKNGEPTTHYYQDMHCELSRAGLEHAVENLSAEPFRNLLIEILPGSAGLARPAQTRGASAGVHASTLYSGESCALQFIQLSSGAQVQLAGPAVVAAPYGGCLELIAPARGVRKLSSFIDLEYLPSGSDGLLRCEAGTGEKVIVVSLGHKQVSPTAGSAAG